MDTQPILTYTDESLNRRQTLTLWEGKVHLKGKMFLKGEYEASFSLEALSPNHQVVTMRDNSFWLYLWMIIITVGIAGVYHAIPGTSTESYTGLMLTAFPLFPIVCCLMTFGKVRTAQFLSKAGQPLFGIVKGGKEKARFEEVISRLVEQIGNAGTPSPGVVGG